MAVVVEPVVNEEKLNLLLHEQCESEQLDFKDIEDLSKKSALIEITKDIAAMMASGGYLVIGVDGHGKPTGNMNEQLAELFDEARLRPKLLQYLAPPVNVLTAQHDVEGNVVILLYVAPHVDGFAIINQLGQYPISNRPDKVVFRPGDVFVRHGTSSERWVQGDIPGLLKRRDERIREEIRAEFAKTLAAMQQGQLGQQLATGPAAGFTWQVDEVTFDAVTTELIRRNDRVPLRLLLLSIVGDAEAAFTNDDEELFTILDRLTSLLAIAITLGDAVLRDDAVKALSGIYRLGFDAATGYQRNDLGTRPEILWREIVSRVEGVGALAVRLADWVSVGVLAIQQPGSGAENSYYASWLRHGLTSAARANVVPKASNGRDVPGFLVALGRNHTNRLPALRPDRPDDGDHDPEVGARPQSGDFLLDSLCQFDALWGIVAMSTSGEISSGQFYTSFAAYYSQRTVPILIKLLDDAEMRQALAPGVPLAVVEAAVGESLRLAQGEGMQLNGSYWAVNEDRLDELRRQAGVRA